jgi:hypothetical protein
LIAVEDAKFTTICNSMMVLFVACGCNGWDVVTHVYVFRTYASAQMGQAKTNLQITRPRVAAAQDRAIAHTRAPAPTSTANKGVLPIAETQTVVMVAPAISENEVVTTWNPPVHWKRLLNLS